MFDKINPSKIGGLVLKPIVQPMVAQPTVKEPDPEPIKDQESLEVDFDRKEVSYLKDNKLIVLPYDSFSVKEQNAIKLLRKHFIDIPADTLVKQT